MSVKNLKYNQAYLTMIGREMPPSYPLPSTDIPPLASAIPGTFHGSRSDLGTGTTIPPFTNPVPPHHTNNVPSISSDDRIRGTLNATLDDNPDLSLLSLIDLEQAIEHVTELILTPGLLNSGSPSSATLAGVYKCNNSHLLVDGKVQWKKALYSFKITCPSCFRRWCANVKEKYATRFVYLLFWFRPQFMQVFR